MSKKVGLGHFCCCLDNAKELKQTKQKRDFLVKNSFEVDLNRLIVDSKIILIMEISCRRHICPKK